MYFRLILPRCPMRSGGLPATDYTQCQVTNAAVSVMTGSECSSGASLLARELFALPVDDIAQSVAHVSPELGVARTGPLVAHSAGVFTGTPYRSASSRRVSHDLRPGPPWWSLPFGRCAQWANITVSTGRPVGFRIIWIRGQTLGATENVRLNHFQWDDN